MISVVRPAERRRSAAWISCSVRLSSAEVASSRIRIERVLQHHARDRDPLLLAAGQLEAALADQGP